MRILERLEVDQRRRLEQVLRELKETRKFLQRTQVSNTTDGLSEPGDEPGDGPPDETASSKQKAEQERELRRLFAQRALLQIDKSRQEILGSAAAFEDLRLQIINNRIVGTNRETRFERQIIGPLSALGEQTMETLKAKVTQLESELEEVERINAEAVVAQGGSVSAEERESLENASRLSTNDSIEQVDVAIEELDKILSLLLKFETQNELLDIVRRMIADQKALLERTKKQRQKEAFEGLLD